MRRRPGLRVWWDPDDDYIEPPVPDYSGLIVVVLDEDVDDEGLVDHRGDPLYTEAPPFGFCSQRHDR